ncbi:hypothetical protein BH23ACT3_BH23ACT3_13950 [soil metagenome]
MTYLIGISAAPSGNPAVLAAMLAVLAWIVHIETERRTRPPRPIEIGDRRPPADEKGRLEEPAVVGLLTNGYEVPTSAVAATARDLARRGWIRLAATDEGELVVFTRGSGRHGDVLRGFEQQVLNHLTARSFDGVTTAGTLIATAEWLDRRWWRRFRRDVVRAARERRLTTQRYTPGALLASMAVVLVAALTAYSAVSPGDPDVAVGDSLVARAVWWAGVALVVGVALALVRRSTSSCETPTEHGQRRAGQWLGYRSRLAEHVPDHASVVAPAEQQLALAFSVVMGLAPGVVQQLPIVREDHRRAWSDAGGTPHVVRVRYPFRPGYGRNPLVLGGVGVVVLLAARWAQLFLRRVADGEGLQRIVENFPDQTSIIERVAEILAIAMWLPIVWAVWAVIAGVVDSIWTNERIGAVVRARRPVDVIPSVPVLRPLAERDRFSIFLAVDDGRRQSVTAWMANERTAAPQGAFARVRSTPVLGYVRTSEPVGTSTRRDPA